MPSSDSPASGTSALLGHTGFVGGNLAAQHKFSAGFNSKNFRDLAGQRFDLVVCAAVPAVKWQANRDPAADWARIEPLLEVLTTIEAKRFVLISTIDVYPDPRGVDETFDPLSLANHAYGAHRARVEAFVRESFPVHNIIRLPGLFGAGLKKNVIYDLLHDHGLDSINPASSFQYYDLARIWADIEKTIAADLSLLNLATEPLPTSAIASRLFPGKAIGGNPAPAAFYDFRSCHSALWDRADGYLYSAATVLEDLCRFVVATRGV